VITQPLLGMAPNLWSTAACRGQTDTMYPETITPAALAAARAICAPCPVQRECLAAGLGEEFGVWAGTTPAERVKLRLQLAPHPHWPVGQLLSDHDLKSLVACA